MRLPCPMRGLRHPVPRRAPTFEQLTAPVLYILLVSALLVALGIVVATSGGIGFE